jgi:DNA-binding MarR family transcriptional regulator
MSQQSVTRDHQHVAMDDLSPSAKLVFKTLENEGRLTQKQLANETFLVRRTVRSAIRQLEQAGMITSRVNFEDARQDIYSPKEIQENR